MAVAIYSYGSLQLNANSAGLGLFLLSKNLDMVEYQPSLTAIARQDLYKINGYQVSARHITCEILVVGTTRTDCIARKDALEAGLAPRDQQLIIHEDGRYWTANAVTGKAKFAAGAGIVQCRIPVAFVCANPFAVAAAAATPFDSGTLAYTSNGAQYVSPTFAFLGGGSAYSYPQLHIINTTPTAPTTTLTSALVAGTAYTSLAVVSTPTQYVAGQVLIVTYTSGSPSFQIFVQKVTVSVTTAAAATSIPVNSFTPIYAMASGSQTTVGASIAWTNVTVAQLTDNYTISATTASSTSYALSGGGVGYVLPAILPQINGDFLDIYCDPQGTNGLAVISTVDGIAAILEPIGAFPVLEPTLTQWTVQITADSAPSADFSVIWTPRYAS